MAHYKDSENKLHFLEDDSLGYILPLGCVKITDAEADALREAQRVAAEAATPGPEKAKRKIIYLEVGQTPRRIREALLDIADKVGADCAFLRDLDAKIKTERGKL